MTTMINSTTFGSIHNGFQVVPLPEVVFFQEGPGLRKWQWTESGMKVINVKNILSDGNIDTSNTSRHISLEEFEKTYSHFAIEPGDIVVASSGNTYGKIGRIASQHLPLMMNTSVIRFHPSDDAKVNPDYLFGFIRSHLFRNQIEQFVIGSAQPNFGPTHLKQMQFVLPPMEVQNRIASILSAYDDLIENNARRIAILEEMARRIYQEWFVHLRFPGHEKVRMVESELGEIPEGWEIKKMSEVCVRITDGAHASPKSVAQGYPMASVKDMTTWGIDVSTCRQISEADYQKLVKMDCKPLVNDVLIAKDGSYLKHAFVTEEEMDLVVLSSIAIIRPDTAAIDPHVLCLYLKQPEIKTRLAGYVSGSALPRIILKDFAGFLIQVPPSTLQDGLMQHLEPMVQMIHSLLKKNANLHQTRDLLLPKLISGEIDVSEMPEPKEAAA